LGVNAQRPVADDVRTLRLGFVGLGWIGRKRLDALADQNGVEIAALADSDRAKLDSAVARYPAAHAASELEALFECDLDGVVIATPNAAHAAQAIACLSRGLPVFCQKPLGVTGREAEDVIAAAAGADRLLGLDFCYRHVRGMRELRRRIGAGELGDILSVDLKFHNAYGPDKPWAYDRVQSGGGALLDLGIHLLDLALWLQAAPDMRRVSSQLFARGRALAAGAADIEDMACAELRQENGAVIRLACSWNAHAGCDAVIALELLGSRGGAAWRNVNGSFYDFTLDVFRGRTSERVAGPPDDWGVRGLSEWIERLRLDERFDEEARLYARSARLIDEIYAA
jgi:predicted dehydrogenase